MINLVPAIDIIDGKCVRLSQGDYSAKSVYFENPLEVAKMFEGAGIKRLHLVDLDGAKANHIVNYRVLESIASKTKLTIDFGGGVKSDNDLAIAFDNGAEMVTGGSIAVKNAELFSEWLSKYGGEKIILGSDVKNEKIAVSGWKEESSLELIPFLGDYIQKGATQTICTDISKDGMLQGPSIELYKKIIAKYPTLRLVASGGVSSWNDIEELDKIGCSDVIFGKAFYEGYITLKEIEKFVVNS